MKPTSTVAMDMARVRAWVFFFLYVFLLFYLSHQPRNPNSVPPFPTYERFVHFCEFLVLAIFYQRALVSLKPYVSWNRRRLALVTLFTAMTIALADEAHLYLILLRQSDWKNFIFDLAGITLGILVYQGTIPRDREELQ